MLAFIEMLMAPAEKAGMKIPTDPRNFDRNQFPHFTVYAAMQLGQSMPTPTSHWHNATVIAAIPDEKIRELVTVIKRILKKEIKQIYKNFKGKAIQGATDHQRKIKRHRKFSGK